MVVWTFFGICLSLGLKWRRQWHPTPVLLPRKSHGRRSLVGCSPWGHKESDMTERLHFHFLLHALEKEMATHSCSCLKNPRDGGAWWAAVYGVAQSWTRLKLLSSSSSSRTEMKTDLSQSCGHCWLFQFCWHIEGSTLTATSFRIWKSSARIPSPPQALFKVMFLKAHLTSHSRISGLIWVIIPSWLSVSLKPFCTVLLCILATSS